jgi:hypothetical protein
MDFFLNNWAELLLAFMVFAKVVVNLTPSVKDDRVFAYVDLLLNAIIASCWRARAQVALACPDWWTTPAAQSPSS